MQEWRQLRGQDCFEGRKNCNRRKLNAVKNAAKQCENLPLHGSLSTNPDRHMHVLVFYSRLSNVQFHLLEGLSFDLSCML